MFLKPPCRLILLLVCAYSLAINCRRKSPLPEALRVFGEGLGTFFSIQAYPNLPLTREENEREKAAIQAELLQMLSKIDQIFSNWRKDSEVQRFNRRRERSFISISEDLWKVVHEAKNIHKLSSGALDPGQEELFWLWGFGGNTEEAGKRVLKRVPEEEEIQIFLKRGGMDQIALSPPQRNGSRLLRKLNPYVQLNLSSLAKGYAVDQAAKILQKRGFDSYTAEIGGELRIGGAKPNGRKWMIGVEKPEYQDTRTIWKRLLLENIAVAGSGNYRNYFTQSGKRYSHILDPRTGYPAQSSLAAVNVVGPSCMRADALSTALMLLNLKEGKKIIENLPKYEALWIERVNGKKSDFQTLMSTGMKSFLIQER